MTGVSGRAARISCAARRPSALRSGGIWMSVITTSGRCALATRTRSTALSTPFMSEPLRAVLGEDQAIVREGIATILRNAGITVVAAPPMRPRSVPCAEAWFAGYFRLSVSPADTFREVVVVPGKYQRQLPADVTATLVVSLPASPVVTVLTVL
jgi:hypothetical protein